MVSPVDVITYVGVPLAVLGVSPILYNFLIAFLIRLRLQRQLKTAGIFNDTRINSRLINGIVELELPIYDLFLEGCPRLWSRFVAKRTGTKEPYVLGGTWTQISHKAGENGHDIIGKNQVKLSKQVAGHVTKEFQRSTQLALPAASAPFADFLGYFLHLSSRDESCQLDASTFDALREYGPDLATGLKLLRYGRESSPGDRKTVTINITASSAVPNYIQAFISDKADLLRVVVARSDLENRGSLTLRLTKRPPPLPTNLTRQGHKEETSHELKDRLDYLSEIEATWWPSRSTSWGHPVNILGSTGLDEYNGDFDPLNEVKIPELGVSNFDLFDRSKNRYFLLEQAWIDQASNPTGVPASSGKNLNVDIPNKSSSSNQKAHNSTDELDEKNVPVPEFGADGEGENFVELEASATVVITEHPASPSQIPQDAVVPRQNGIYIWIYTSGISQAFKLTSVEQSVTTIKGLARPDPNWPFYVPSAGLGSPITLHKDLQNNPVLQHAFAAVFELPNFRQMPRFEYSSKVLYKAIHSFVGIRALATMTSRKMVTEAMRVAKYEMHSLNGLAPEDSETKVKAAESFQHLSEPRLKDLESRIDPALMSYKRESEPLLSLWDSEYVLNEMMTPHLPILKTDPPAPCVRVSDLRAAITADPLWKLACKSLIAQDKAGKSIKSAYRLFNNRVPTAQEILYCILEDRTFLSHMNAVIGHIMDSLRRKRGPLSDEYSPFAVLLCAIILIDEVGKNAEKFMLADD